MISAGGLSRHYPALLGSDRETRAIASLKKAKAAGIQTMLDATTFDLGRDSEPLKEVSEGSGVNLINVTGWWLDVPRFLQGVGPNQMADEFVKDIQEGFRGTNIKARMLNTRLISKVLHDHQRLWRELLPELTYKQRFRSWFTHIPRGMLREDKSRFSEKKVWISVR